MRGPAALRGINPTMSRRPASQQQLPVGDIYPSIVLEADLAKSGNSLETQLLMQRDTRFIRQGNAADGDMNAALSEQGQQRGIERGSDAAAFTPALEVDSGLRGIFVGAS